MVENKQVSFEVKEGSKWVCVVPCWVRLSKLKRNDTITVTKITDREIFVAINDCKLYVDDFITITKEQLIACFVLEGEKNDHSR